MGIELVNKEQLEGIWPDDMKDGDIGIIVSCEVNEYIGRIVQRYEDKLISIGMSSDYRWGTTRVPKNFRVRLLEKGEMLVVT